MPLPMRTAALLAWRHRRSIGIKRTASSVLARSLCGGNGAHGAKGAGSSVESTKDEVGLENCCDVKNDGREFDVAIIGGGMVGMALGCALSSMALTKHLRIAIVDGNPALGSKSSFTSNDIPDPRVSAVTPATISFFKEMGAWEYVQQQRHAYFNKMQVWDYTGLGFTRYNAKDIGKENLGCVVENNVLHNSLTACLRENTDSLKTFFAGRLNSMNVPLQASYMAMNLDGPSTIDIKDGQQHLPHGSLVKLDLSNGRSIYAKLVVGADGSKSRVREISGIKTTGWNYSQNAIICTVEHVDTNHCAWQRFLPSGPIALLPMGDQFSNIVWTMSPPEALERKTMNHDEFVNSVNHALDYGYGPHPHSSFLNQYVKKIPLFSELGASSVREDFQVPPKVSSLISERMAFPLSLKHAHDYVLKRIVLVGDAAHTVHPLAGQGVNLGFGDASALSKTIADGISAGIDIGELSVLKKYERERKAANVTMMAIVDGFQKAYSVDLGPLNILRAAAFHGAQYISPLKKNIISYATGDQKWPIFT